MSRITEELERLAALLEKGLLTRQEYDLQKANILGQASPPPEAISPSTPLSAAKASDELLTGPTRVNPPTEPERVGSYQILGQIGRGGMGIVYRARHLLEPMSRKQGGDVALKLMHPELASDESYRQRFIDEANHGLILDHPGVIQVHEVLIDDDRLGLIMSICEGDTLEERAAGKPMSIDQVVAVLEPVANALDHVHAQGIIHRDLKPENIKFNAEGRPVILDFGIAKDTDTSGKTKTGTGMGTVAYMAPEQYTDAKRVGPGSDQYALGIIAYELVSGGLPWPKGESEFNVLTAKANGRIPNLAAALPDLPDHICQAIARATAVSIEDRFGCCMDLVRAIGAVEPAESKASPQVNPAPEAAPETQVARDSSPQSGAEHPSFPERNATLHTVLTVVSCGLWSLVWYYLLGNDIRQAKGGNSPNVAMDLLLWFLTCGIWAFVIIVRCSEHINDMRRDRGMKPVQDILMISMLLGIFTGFFHLTYWQVQLNRISRGDD